MCQLGMCLPLLGVYDVTKDGDREPQAQIDESGEWATQAAPTTADDMEVDLGDEE